MEPIFQPIQNTHPQPGGIGGMAGYSLAGLSANVSAFRDVILPLCINGKLPHVIRPLVNFTIDKMDFKRREALVRQIYPNILDD